MVDGHLLADLIVADGTPVLTHGRLASSPGTTDEYVVHVPPYYPMDPPPVSQQEGGGVVAVRFLTSPAALPTETVAVQGVWRSSRIESAEIVTPNPLPWVFVPTAAGRSQEPHPDDNDAQRELTLQAEEAAAGEQLLSAGGGQHTTRYCHLLYVTPAYADWYASSPYKRDLVVAVVPQPTRTRNP